MEGVTGGALINACEKVKKGGTLIHADFTLLEDEKGVHAAECALRVNLHRFAVCRPRFVWSVCSVMKAFLLC